jgi:hypothetical protein
VKTLTEFNMDTRPRNARAVMNDFDTCFGGRRDVEGTPPSPQHYFEAYFTIGVCMWTMTDLNKWFATQQDCTYNSVSCIKVINDMYDVFRCSVVGIFFHRAIAWAVCSKVR